MERFPPGREDDLHTHNSVGGSKESRNPDLDRIFWQQFAEAATPKAFCQSWLPLQCRKLKGVRCAIVLWGPPDHGPFTPVAVWPDAKLSMHHLTGAAERALKERRGLLIETNTQPTPDNPFPETYQVAYPIEVSEKLHGVVVLGVDQQDKKEVQNIMRQLHWGSAWLEVLTRRTEALKSAAANERLQKVLDLIASAVEHENFQAAATALVTRLATSLGCDRVSIGFLKKDQVRIEALSHSAQFGKQMNLIRAIGNAMDESLEQAVLLLYPPPEEKHNTILRDHAELARQHNSDTILTIPFLDEEGEGYGALTLERTSSSEQDSFDKATINLCDTVASFIGPILEEKRLNDRPLASKIKSSFQNQISLVLGADHLAVKLIIIAALFLVIFFAFAKGHYRVTAKTALEGEIQRAVTAPFEGYLDESEVKAGDLVKEGQIVARLNDRDLNLERSKWASQLAQYQMENRKAMAEGETAAASILQQQVHQAEAQLRLLDEQLSRTRITAPFSGLVVSGDLSQSLGTPLEKGQVLFEIAPLDSYRVVLQVDETEISAILPGQQGELILSAMPDTHLTFTVQTVTPVILAEEGRSYFKVEASLDKHSQRLRPGMEGYGKIFVDRRRLIWIWTHDLITWLRLKMWSWLP